MVVAQPVGLDLISAGAHGGCMGLPQELLDCIMDMLCDDLRTLKACSLTCKALFASTRHLIHQTLHLSARFLSYMAMGERGLLRYTRHLHIPDRSRLTPSTLLPHLHHFQSLDRVHTITITNYDAIRWGNDHRTFFANFYPTLTSLTLAQAFGSHQSLFQFVLQFPNLENLCLEWLKGVALIVQDLASPVIIDKPPPLRGHFRLVGRFSLDAPEWPMDGAQFSNVFNFRSVELDDLSGNQYILKACAHTLESLTIIPRRAAPHHGHEYMKLLHIVFTEVTILRRLAFRLKYDPVYPLFGRDALLEALLTITSPNFCELVLELGGYNPYRMKRCTDYWGSWEETDRFLKEEFAEHRDFRLIIRTDEPYARQLLESHVGKTFPLLSSRGCVHLEYSQ
ncbi:hypothetical protein BJ322DRAFT_240217 [Thelephora terrestris]|uniref:F-box domain-containing protein n=1 Tax=Thelephora terrestris TaxID=56493 RepID=A0A9P6L429_9AGAM|nr:hypothetical protein BJ322DRAFT_240217 [Thelephora terrestris]